MFRPLSHLLPRKANEVVVIGSLARQLKTYQATGRPILLELFRTKTDPITEGYIEDLVKALQAAGVQITREQIRLVELP